MSSSLDVTPCSHHHDDHMVDDVIPNMNFNLSEFEYKIVNDEFMINFTKASQHYGSGKPPSYYRRENLLFSSNEATFNSNQYQFLNCVSIVIFLLHSSTKCKESFIVWIANCLQQCIMNNGRMTQEIDNSEMVYNSKRVDLSEFGVCCEGCQTPSFLKVKPTAKKSIWDLSCSNYRNKRVEAVMSVIKGLFDCKGYAMHEILALYYQNAMDEFKKLINYVMRKPNTDEIVVHRYINIKKYVTNKLEEVELRTSKFSAQYWKDFNLVSDEKYQSMVHWFGFTNLLPCSRTLCRLRTELHQSISEAYNFKFTSTTTTCYFPKVIQSLFKIHTNECIRQNIPANLTCVDFKLAIDKGANSFVVAALGPLGLILADQSRWSHLTCAMVDGDESKESSKSMFEFVIDTLQKCCVNGIIRICGIAIRIFVVNDLKMVGLLTDLNENNCFCPFCTCPKNERHLFEQHYHHRTLKYYVRYFTFSIITLICSLHMKMRVVSNLILQIMLRINNINTFTLIQERIQTLSHCSQFAFRTTKEKADDEDDEIDQTKLHLPYLNGDQCDEILENFEMIFDGIIDYHETLIWQIVRVIFFNFVDGSYGRKGDEDFYRVLSLLCRSLGDLLATRYTTSKFAYYMHILVKHLPDLTFEFGALSKYANQGSENIHAGHLLAVERLTSAGGKSSNPKVPMVQVHEQELRRFYLASEYDFPWLGKLNDFKPTSETTDDQKNKNRLAMTMMKLVIWQSNPNVHWIRVMISELGASSQQLQCTQVPPMQIMNPDFL